MEGLREELAQFCASRKIERFEPDEIIELLEDGESVEWIVGQLAPTATAAAVVELSLLLQEIADAVGPAPEPAEDTALEAAEDAPAALPGDDEAGEVAELADLSAMPLPPGVDPAQVQQLLSSPQGEMLADFGAFCQERGVDAEPGQEGMEDLLRELHEEWLETPRESMEGKKPSELVDGGRLFPQKVETYRRDQPKVGRNDPCPCGSGKKFKKCCGRGG